MITQPDVQSLTSTLALVAHGKVAAWLDASVPAIVLAGDGRTLRFLNAAAARILGITKARSALGVAAPLDEAVLKHLQRVTSATLATGSARNAIAGKPTSERIRYYSGFKPMLLALTIEPLGVVAGDAAFIVTLPELARHSADIGLKATIDLYAGPDDLITIFGHDDVLAVAGPQSVIDDAAGEIETIVDRASGEPIEMAHVATPQGRRAVMLARIEGDTPARRLLYIGPTEPVPQAEIDESVSTVGAAPAASMGDVPSVSPQATALDDSFKFTADAKPRRFAWEIDASTRFVAIGPEFAASLGGRAAPQIGECWQDLTTRLAIDVDGRIASLIRGHGPWHGQRVAWPVQGEALRVTVDLTAMPIKDGALQFAGFRGFGVIRLAEAVFDPAATGASLVPARPESVQAEPAPEIVPTAEPQPTQDPAAVPESLQTQSDIEHITAIGTASNVERWLAPKRLSPSALVQSVAPNEDAPLSQPMVSARTSELHLVRHTPVAHISPETLRLSGDERNAFRQIAEALGARFEGDDVVAAPVARKAGEMVSIVSTRELLDQLNGRRQPAAAAPTGMASSGLDVQTLENGWRPPVPTEGDTRLIDRLPIAVGLTRDEKIIHVNAAFLALTEYVSLDELDRAGGLDALFAGPHAAKGWPEDRSRHHIPLVTKSGRVLPVDARIASVPWTGGAVLLMTLVAGDRPLSPSVEAASVAAQPDPSNQMSRESVADAETRARELELILTAATDGIVTLSADGRIRTANQAAETLFGFRPGELVGGLFIDLMEPDSRRAASNYLDALARNGIGSLLSEGCELTGVRLARANEPEQQIALHTTMIRIRAVPEPMFAGVFRDMNRWKTSEDELLQAKQRAEAASLQKTEFLAKISHEIRTPLNAIIGFSEVMLGERFGAIGVERYKDYLRDIQSSGTHILSLVNDLLDLSKVEAGKLELKFESVQLIDVLSDCIQLMQPQANRERIIIRASLTQNLPPVVADQRSIRQIVLNLLSNAIKFTPPGGQVIVSAALEDSNEVVIRVRDTGYGMSAGDIEIALEPFRQVHNGRGGNTGRRSGTGLGLPLTKALVEANRAAIKIDSAVNQGTLVQVTFPAPNALAAE